MGPLEEQSVIRITEPCLQPLGHASNPHNFIFGKAVVSLSGMWSGILICVQCVAVRSGWLADPSLQKLLVYLGGNSPYSLPAVLKYFINCCPPWLSCSTLDYSDLTLPTQHSSLPFPLLPFDPPHFPSGRYCFSVCFLEINFLKTWCVYFTHALDVKFRGPFVGVGSSHPEGSGDRTQVVGHGSRHQSHLHV